MGTSYEISCKNCSFKKEVNVGIGMMHSTPDAWILYSLYTIVYTKSLHLYELLYSCYITFYITIIYFLYKFYINCI